MGASLMQSFNVYNCAPSSIIAANEDIFNGNPETDRVSLENYESIMFIIVKNAGATGTATITVNSYAAASGGSGTAIAYHYKTCTSGNTWGAATAVASTGFTTTAGANQCYLIEVNSSEVTSNQAFVSMTCTEVVDSPCDGAVLCIVGKPRYAKDVMLDATS